MGTRGILGYLENNSHKSCTSFSHFHRLFADEGLVSNTCPCSIKSLKKHILEHWWSQSSRHLFQILDSKLGKVLETPMYRLSMWCPWCIPYGCLYLHRIHWEIHSNVCVVLIYSYGVPSTKNLYIYIYPFARKVQNNVIKYLPCFFFFFS